MLTARQMAMSWYSWWQRNNTLSYARFCQFEFHFPEIKQSCAKLFRLDKACLLLPKPVLIIIKRFK